MEEDHQASSSQSAAKKVGKQHNTLPLWGNESTMNLNPLILANIQSSSYFKVHLFKLKTYHEVVDEIYYQVKHMEPWERGSRKTSGQTGMCGGVRGVGAGGIVSTAYCLLYKLYTLRLTRKQVNGLINHTDSPYIRALGFMYLRYTQPPADLYDWYEDYLQDEEEIDVKAGGGQTITMGQMVYQFLTKLDWFSTLFPRIPVPIQKQIEKKIEQYCRENNVTVHQLSSGPNIATTNSRANRADFEPEAEGHAEVQERWRSKAAVSNYRGEHDDRADYRTSSSREYREHRDYKSKRYEERYSSPESVYRGTSRERERYREKHKKKHKHKHHSRSRSRSRSHSRSHSDRKRNERDHHHHHRSKGYSDGYPEDRRYR
ncbi:pre-mRNA-splicing factor 38B isoform X1 [Lucilia cuprina]|nr:pre-mRNA-splicing factor 38B isoform X1 [Lucilia cuprina]XP_046801865.1 pre-mRNA-splicing factor 38B isoform X1 [Lucilia cuprina]KAI8125558.1 Pre-mRNA-splicing factor 38B [Lucilia cuprina]